MTERENDHNHKVVVLFVHGISYGQRIIDYQNRRVEQNIIRELERKGVCDSSHFVYKAVNYAKPLYKQSDDMWKSTGRLKYSSLRYLTHRMFSIGMSYFNDESYKQQVYATVTDALREAAVEASPDAPLCVVGISFGTVITPHVFSRLQTEPYDPSKSLLEQGRTLTNFYSMGCPYSWFFPNTVPSLNVPPWGEWVNFYYRSDVVAGPIEPLKEQYKNRVTDVELPCGLNPLLHLPTSHGCYGFKMAQPAYEHIASRIISLCDCNAHQHEKHRSNSTDFQDFVRLGSKDKKVRESPSWATFFVFTLFWNFVASLVDYSLFLLGRLVRAAISYVDGRTTTTYHRHANDKKKKEGVLFIHGLTGSKGADEQNSMAARELQRLSHQNPDKEYIVETVQLSHLLRESQTSVWNATVEELNLTFHKIRHYILFAWPYTMGYLSEELMRARVHREIDNALERMERCGGTSMPLHVVGYCMGSVVAMKYCAERQHNPRSTGSKFLNLESLTTLTTVGSPLSWFYLSKRPGEEQLPRVKAWNNLFYRSDWCALPLGGCFRGIANDMEIFSDHSRGWLWGLLRESFLSHLIYLHDERVWHSIQSILES